MDKDEKIKAIKLAKARDKYYKENNWLTVFNKQFSYDISEYPLHKKFLDLTAQYDTICLMSGNQVGKSMLVSYLISRHAEGVYPEWYEGKRFEKSAPFIVVASETNQAVKNNVQSYLVQKSGIVGHGFLTKKSIIETTKMAQGGGYQELKIQHSSGELSTILFMAYSQQREKFQGLRADIVWFDEQPTDTDIFAEAAMRLIAKKGQFYLTFTPLQGANEIVNMFIPNGEYPKNSYVINPKNNYATVNVAMTSVPHLSADQIKATLDAEPDPRKKDARLYGLPFAGSGLVYAGHMPAADVFIDPIRIPKKWHFGYGLDISPRRAAAVFFARDPNTDTYYLYKEIFLNDAYTDDIARQIKAQANGFMIGAVDPASLQKGADGFQFFQKLVDLGLDIVPADNAVNTGINKVLEHLSAGKLKIFNTCENVMNEYLLYKWDAKNPDKVVKVKDDLMDAIRYFFMTGVDYIEPWSDKGQSSSQSHQLFKYEEDR